MGDFEYGRKGLKPHHFWGLLCAICTPLGRFSFTSYPQGSTGSEIKSIQRDRNFSLEDLPLPPVLITADINVSLPPSRSVSVSMINRIHTVECVTQPTRITDSNKNVF